MTKVFAQETLQKREQAQLVVSRKSVQSNNHVESFNTLVNVQPHRQLLGRCNLKCNRFAQLSQPGTALKAVYKHALKRLGSLYRHIDLVTCVLAHPTLLLLSYVVAGRTELSSDTSFYAAAFRSLALSLCLLVNVATFL